MTVIEAEEKRSISRKETDKYKKEQNIQLITKMGNSLLKQGKQPTQTEISTISGLSLRTVQRLWNNVKFKTRQSRFVSKERYLK